MGGLPNAVWSRIADIQTTVMTTIGINGILRSRPMQTLGAPENGVLWFLADSAAQVVEEVQGDARVALSYVDEATARFVFVAGTAEVVVDAERARRLWDDRLHAWLPRRPDHDRSVLLKVSVTHAEAWESSEGRLVTLNA